MTASEPSPAVKHKVLAYITRQHDRRTRLLVFDHGDDPEAGTQVPAGTVGAERGEPGESALFREIFEESGLNDVRLVRELAEHEEVGWDQIRRVFHLTAPEATPDRGSHTVGGTGEDSGMVFEYYWADIEPGLGWRGTSIGGCS